MFKSKNKFKLRIALITVVAAALAFSAGITANARDSINEDTEKPYVSDSVTEIDSGFEIRDDWEGLIAVDADTDAYESEELRDLVNRVNGGEDIPVSDYIKYLPEVNGKTDPENFPTTDGYDINLKLYDRITPFYDLVYHYADGHESDAKPGKTKLVVPECEGMDGNDLMILIIDEKTGEMYLVPIIKFNSDTGEMVVDLPCVGAFCVLHKIPIVVRNVDPDLYPNRELAAIIEKMPYNETLECEWFLEQTLEEDDVSELEVADGVTIKTSDYSSAIALSDVAVHLGEDEDGNDQFSYDLSTRFKANLFRANDKVNWERMLKYERIDYDKDAVMADDKELTEIEPFTLEDSFLYHIDAVTREVSIIYEPTICWETYGELTEEKANNLTQENIQYFDVDDIDGQEIEDRKLVLDDEELEELEADDEESSILDDLGLTAYAADLILDEIEEGNSNQPLDEDDVCLVINGDQYLGMGPFLVFMPKKEHKTVFPWWILLILAALACGGYIYYKKNKNNKQAA